MIERRIFTALTNMIAELTSSPAKFVNFLVQEHDITLAEATALQAKFVAAPPNVIHGFPRKDAKFPLYCILLVEEKEQDKYFNDESEIFDIQDAVAAGIASLAGSEVKSSIWRHEYAVITLTDHPDVTICYYELAKYALLRYRDFLRTNGLLNIELSGGLMEPDPRYMPEFLFARRLTLSCTSEQYAIADRIPPIRSVDGIFVNDGTPGNGVTPLVSTGVTIPFGDPQAQTHAAGAGLAPTSPGPQDNIDTPGASS